MPSMTYILQSQFESELSARKEYLLNTFHLYFVEVKRTHTFIELQSFPFKDDNIVMLYGHYPWILFYFMTYGAALKYKTKIINSCYPHLAIPLLKQENIFYSKVNSFGEACCYDGRKFGIPFNITDSELDALNSAHLPLMDQIKFAYERVA